jgi:hypothetical protein
MRALPGRDELLVDPMAFEADEGPFAESSEWLYEVEDFPDAGLAYKRGRWAGDNPSATVELDPTPLGSGSVRGLALPGAGCFTGVWVGGMCDLVGDM